MPEFDYTALSKTGGEVTGREYADDIDALKSVLKRRRLVLLKAKARKASRVRADTVARLVAELADLAENDVIIERALQTVADDESDKAVASLAAHLRGELQMGASLSASFSQLDNVPPLVAPMLRAGEATGQLAGMLRRLSDHFERSRDLRRELQSSLAYPAILVIVSLLSLIGMAFFVVPVFRGLFDEGQADLPLGTRIVFDVSDWLVVHGATLFGAVTVGLVLTGLLVNYLPGARDRFDRLLLAVPLVGKTIALSQSANLTGVLGTLLVGGVPLVSAVQIAGETSSNRYMRRLMTRVQTQIRQGEGFAKTIAQLDMLPTNALRLIGIGDEAGRLGPACSKASLLLEKALRSRLKSLVALVEPVTILFMGGVVGFVVVSMLLAVFGLTDIAA